MRVLAKVHESRISQIRKGLTAEVIADALPDRPLTGTVVTVSEYPIPSTSVYTTHIKEYAVEVEIHSPPPQLRPGMSAQVNILVEHLDSQLQIPIDAAISRGDRYFVAVPRQDGTFETREIKVGSANDTIITIRSGLEVGEKVVLNHREIAHKLDLPELKGPNAPDTEAVAATTETQPAAAADSSVLKTPAVADGKAKPTSDTTSHSAK
jgi:multidrug efflux pump subunit AcrA (membrane-fusion protein)